jgi:hypothetical protein
MPSIFVLLLIIHEHLLLPIKQGFVLDGHILVVFQAPQNLFFCSINLFFLSLYGLLLFTLLPCHLFQRRMNGEMLIHFKCALASALADWTVSQTPLTGHFDRWFTCCHILFTQEAAFAVNNPLAVKLKTVASMMI